MSTLGVLFITALAALALGLGVARSTQGIIGNHIHWPIMGQGVALIFFGLCWAGLALLLMLRAVA